jgi:Ca2+-dependent lipid-binding protein
MYDPNVFTLNLEQLMSGAPIDAAIGVLQVKLYSARALKASKLGGGAPDPYVSLSINNRAELAKTKYKHSTYNPSWTETKFLLVNSLTEQLVLSVLDYNDHRKDTPLGAASFELAALEKDGTQESIVKQILKDGKERGEIRFDCSWYPVLKPVMVDGKPESPETSVGIVRLVVHQAKDLDNSKSLSGELNPFAKVYIGDNHKPILTTHRFKHTNNPVWESPIEFLCSDKNSSVITVKVIDDRDFLKDPVVGFMAIKLADLFTSQKEAGRDWWPLSGCKSGRIRLSVEWKPLAIAGSLSGAEQYTPPIGVVRLHLMKATDLKNVEATLGGKVTLLTARTSPVADT